MKGFLIIGWIVFGLASIPVCAQEIHYQAAEGEVYFLSDAPLERIEARNTALRGLVDATTRKFAFSLPISSFQGFNSPLQREHFNENYLESDRYPNGQFTGKIIESIDLTLPGTHEVRAKGKLAVHGTTVERIIPVTLTVVGDTIRVSSQFTVPLSDHNITIPRIVRQKIAEDIAVSVSATLVL